MGAGRQPGRETTWEQGGKPVREVTWESEATGEGTNLIGGTWEGSIDLNYEIQSHLFKSIALNIIAYTEKAQSIQNQTYGFGLPITKVR